VGYWVDVWGIKVRRSCAKSWAAWGLTFEKHISKTIQNINFVELLSVGSEKSPEDSNSIQSNQSLFFKEISVRCTF